MCKSRDSFPLEEIQPPKDTKTPVKSSIPLPDPITPSTILTSSPVLPPSLLFDPRYFFVPEELLPLKKQIHPLSSSSTTLSNSSRKQACILVPPSSSTYTSTPPQIYELGKSSIKMRMPPKRTSISEAPAMTNAAIRKLVANSVATCVEKNKVKFAITTLIEEALFWWNSFAQPIGVKEAYKITWSELKRLLIKKYCPQTEIKKMEEAITYKQSLIKQVNETQSEQKTITT
ncbi:hypothetical protein Tco_0628295 [Tanacetum coccineum]|uniref:Reverse transcriptase domain-containing protein n=1 Tax=Tanacetum coccineum TaxID=301880 RepID=A0ABQ4WQ28_9ASTR